MKVLTIFSSVPCYMLNKTSQILHPHMNHLDISNTIFPCQENTHVMVSLVQSSTHRSILDFKGPFNMNMNVQTITYLQQPESIFHGSNPETDRMPALIPIEILVQQNPDVIYDVVTSGLSSAQLRQYIKIPQLFITSNIQKSGSVGITYQ